ncbi:hypothetical protein [Campylobacter armoricus]|uniref:hypothetical protein n=1 Tax=Campylobacter armoricus TaxID=2505970 RepID=UPI001116B7C9|nr:hypothetical protein [Campylobacter armoricus]
MEKFDKELTIYGIFVKNGKQNVKDNKITIFDAEIEEINFQKLQEKDIKEICILRSEIKYLYFFKKNTIKIDFRNCNFKNQIIARELYFENEVIFQQCIFDVVVDFSKTKFKCKIDFLTSIFKGEVRFIETQFQAKQSDNKIIENDFGEVMFERRVSFSNAIFQERVNFALSQFKDEASFAKTKFQANQNDSNIIENQFLGVIFAGKVTFDEAIFQARVCFGISQFEDEARFIGTQFLAEQDNDSKIVENEFREANFRGKITFDSLVFKARISFLFSTFKDETLFLDINPSNLIFYNVEFNKTKFACKALTNITSCLFQYSVFKDMLSFERMEFERLRFDNVLFNGVITFSDTKLKIKPQFINCTFSNQFNIEHQYIKYSDKDIENKINNIQNENDKFHALLNLRDLFRKLKSNRIAHHNLIDTSELRVQELYARELELKHKENKSLKEKVERWQLFFYRKLCDHHTDLLKVFHNLLIIIMLFGVFSFALDKFKQPSVENNVKYHIVQVDTNESYIFKEHNKTTYNIFGLNINKESNKLDEFIKNNFAYVLILLFIALLPLSFNIFTNLYIFGSFFYVIFNFLDLVTLYIHIVIIGLFVIFALKFILLDDRQEIIRKIIIGISYVVCIFTLLAKPSLMLPVFGSFLEKDTNTTYPLLLSLSVVYFILVALVIFSLQKTARKNSIVPN